MSPSSLARGMAGPDVVRLLVFSRRIFVPKLMLELISNLQANRNPKMAGHIFYRLS